MENIIWGSSFCEISCSKCFFNDENIQQYFFRLCANCMFLPMFFQFFLRLNIYWEQQKELETDQFNFKHLLIKINSVVKNYTKIMFSNSADFFFFFITAAHFLLIRVMLWPYQLSTTAECLNESRSNQNCSGQ